MGRMVRMVPRNWEHPKDKLGNIVPLSEMPDWDESEKTHYQMYEIVTEGTPISPPMETLESLAQWLVENGAYACGDSTATYEEWLGIINGDNFSGLCFVI